MNVFVKLDEQSQARLTVTDGEIIAIGQNDYQRYYMTKALVTFLLGILEANNVFAGCTRKGLLPILVKMSGMNDDNLHILSFISDKIIIFAPD